MITDLPDEVLDKLRLYASGVLSVSRAAWEIQSLGLPGFQDTAAVDVIRWGIETGIGGPWPSKEEAIAQVRKAAERQRATRKD